MTEDLVKSTSSQRSNPRGLRRVRPVPYECCGGMCSFLNSGCFTLCCNGSKTRRRSSVYVPKEHREEEEEETKREDEPGQLSETTKRLIKPNSQDGLTEADLYVFEKVFEVDSDESPRKHLYVTPFEIEHEEPIPKKEVQQLTLEKVDKEEEDTSVLTDDTSASGGDGSSGKKKKKKILSILKIRKSKRKNKEGKSVTSSTHSLACSEFSEDLRNEENIEVETIVVEGVEVSPSQIDEVSHVETESAKEKGNNAPRRFLAMFSSMRVKRGKKKDQTDTTIPHHETEHDSPVLEERIIKHAKVIPLGSGVPPPTEKPVPETKEIQQELEINTQKKPFWKALSKKEKKNEKPNADKEIIDGIKPDLAQINKQDLEKDEKIEIGTDASIIYGSDTPKEVSQNVETKKKTLFGTLKLNKKDNQSPKKQNEQQKSSQIPCLLSACVNSDIKPEADRKNSSDSIEVKTIADEEVEGGAQTIRIVRNQFFPAEVHSTVVQHDDPDREKVHEVNMEGDVNEEHVAPEKVIGVNAPDNMRREELQETDAKKYGVFEKEDFSESLHTLVDEGDGNFILLAPSSAISNPVAESSGEEKTKKKVEEDNDLPEGIYRSTCRLSIEGSGSNAISVSEEQELKAGEAQEEANKGNIKNENESLAENPIDIAKPQQDQGLDARVSEIPPVNIRSSVDTLTGSRENLHAIEKSTETLKNLDEGSSSWIEVANVEELDESKFNYIYKNTLKKVQDGGANLDRDLAEDQVTQESPLTKADEVKDEFAASQLTEDDQGATNSEQVENNCEKCRNDIPKDAQVIQEETKCICTTLTKPRQSLTEIEEGSVKSKVDAFNKSKHPIIVPLNSVEVLKKDDVTISEAHSSPTLGSKSKSATPSPIAAKSRSGTLSSTNSEWQTAEEDMDRMIQGRGSLSGLGLRSDSMASVYSGAGEGRYGTVAVKGQVEFGLQYNYKAGALEIHVKQCKDLAPVDTKRNRSDPYVKVYLLPDKSKSGKRKTKVKKHTLNPVFDETLKFHISLNGLETRTLWLTVWHSDMFGRNDFLGEVMMALENKVFDDPAPVWYNLQERTEPFDDTISFKGDIIVCLKFVPPDMTVQKKGKRSRGTLHVLVKEAKYLTAYKANGTSDPFCKSYLLPDKGRNSKQKTPVVKKTVNPVWNHTFIYEDVTLQELAERCLELTLWDHDRLASNEFLGGVRFSLGTGKHYGKPVEWMDATGKELTLWKSMLERPNFWVEGCLSLRPSLDSRIS